jgi:hypothetical protein
MAAIQNGVRELNVERFWTESRPRSYARYGLAQELGLLVARDKRAVVWLREVMNGPYRAPIRGKGFQFSHPLAIGTNPDTYEKCNPIQSC